MIYEKLAKARVQLQTMNLKKSGKNKFAGFTYYELADFLPAVNKIFLDLKMCSNFSINDGLATLSITDWEDNSVEIFSSPVEDLELKGCTKIQALGGVHTYLKRYLYLNALEIVESDMLNPNVGNNGALKEVEIDADRDLILGLKACSDLNTLKLYYQEHKEHVKDLKKFNKLTTEMKKKLGGE